eukprot:TRINITY_DN62680_c0_g1_i1.p1 TRINITY_DN62680_c0_g1~~TRINITY_DN62680_c0_g1_i1.p1  ORF type:complete len:455 (+),score=36.94 TRINITY_DN62680_c0_g1_i1:57-1421(+)
MSIPATRVFVLFDGTNNRDTHPNASELPVNRLPDYEIGAEGTLEDGKAVTNVVKLRDLICGGAGKSVIEIRRAQTLVPTAYKVFTKTRVQRLQVHDEQDGSTNLILYCEGVGTQNVRTYRDGIAGWIASKVIGVWDLFCSLVGEGMEEIAQEAYWHVCNWVKEGKIGPDTQIVVHGFSRGSVTARLFTLAVDKCSLVDCVDVMPVFHHLVDKKKPKPVPVIPDKRIAFLGIFDCVRGWKGYPVIGFLYGIFRPREMDGQIGKLLDGVIPKCCDKICHALSIHDNRGPFAVTKFRKVVTPEDDPQCEEVWFPGVHSDIGGSNANHQMSDWTLRWMAQKMSGATNMRLADFSVETEVLHADDVLTYMPTFWWSFWVRHIPRDAMVSSVALSQRFEKITRRLLPTHVVPYDCTNGKKAGSREKIVKDGSWSVRKKIVVGGVALLAIGGGVWWYLNNN